jgi:hypothetical protein
MWQHPLVRLVLQALGAWFLLNLLLSVSWWLVVAVVVLSALGAIVNWMLRYDRARLAGLYQNALCKPFIDVVCKLCREQPPVAEAVPAGPAAAEAGAGKEAVAEKPAGDKKPEEIAVLKEPADFERASEALRQVIRGHDAAIGEVFAHLQKNTLLRTGRRSLVGAGPLGAFLLAGADGLGKRSLAVRLGRLVYPKGGILVVDMADCQDPSALASLFGGGREGSLVAAVKARPHHTLVLENIEMATPRLIDRLRQILATGVCADDSNGSTVGFQHCVFVFTTTKAVERLEALRRDGATHDEWHRGAQEALSGEGNLTVPLLALTSAICCLEPPSAITKAEVVMLLMERECKNYNITLEHVAPEILAREVEAIPDAHGFSLVPGRVGKLMRAPLLLAVKRKQTGLRVESRDLTMYGGADNLLSNTDQEIVPT